MMNTVIIFTGSIRLSLLSSLAFLPLTAATGCLPTAEECASYEEGCGDDQGMLADPFGEEGMPEFGVSENVYSDDALVEDDDQGYDGQNGPLGWFY